MDTNYKREAVIYISFLICIIITLLLLPIFLLRIYYPTEYENYNIKAFMDFFGILIIILICSMIIVSIFI
jgi:hypothetical protein